MAQSRGSVTSTIHRSPSVSSTVSRAETFHSFTTVPAHFDDEKDPLVWDQPDKMQSFRSRIDSGFESVGDRTASETEWDIQTIKPARPRQKTTQKPKRPQVHRAHTTSEVNRPSTSPTSSGRQHSRRVPQIDSNQSHSRRHSRQSSRRSSLVAQSNHRQPGSPLSRRSSHAVDPYTAHQRALSIFSAPVSNMDSYPHQAASNITALNNSTSPQTMSAASLAHRPSSSQSTEKQQESRHQEPTIIDWTDPNSRREAYARHDACRRGVEGVWRKIRRFLPGKYEDEMSFYKEKEGRDSDTCSVRRYRLDLPEDDPAHHKEHRAVREKKSWMNNLRDAGCMPSRGRTPERR